MGNFKMFAIRLRLEFLLEKPGKNSNHSRFLKFVLSGKLFEWKPAFKETSDNFSLLLWVLCCFL